MEKLNKFYADLLKRSGKLTDEQQDLLQQAFFPGWGEDSPNKQMLDSARDFSEAYTKWEAEQSRHQNKKETNTMTNEEIDALAAIF